MSSTQKRKRSTSTHPWQETRHSNSARGPRCARTVTKSGSAFLHHSLVIRPVTREVSCGGREMSVFIVSALWSDWFQMTDGLNTTMVMFMREMNKGLTGHSQDMSGWPPEIHVPSCYPKSLAWFKLMLIQIFFFEVSVHSFKILTVPKGQKTIVSFNLSFEQIFLVTWRLGGRWTDILTLLLCWKLLYSTLDVGDSCTGIP